MSTTISELEARQLLCNGRKDPNELHLEGLIGICPGSDSEKPVLLVENAIPDWAKERTIQIGDREIKVSLRQASPLRKIETRFLLDRRITHLWKERRWFRPVGLYSHSDAFEPKRSLSRFLHLGKFYGGTAGALVEKPDGSHFLLSCEHVLEGVEDAILGGLLPSCEVMNSYDAGLIWSKRLKVSRATEGSVEVGETVTQWGCNGKRDGTVFCTSAYVWVDYGQHIYLFKDQILVEGDFAVEGDSGAMVTNASGEAVGILAARSLAGPNGQLSMVNLIKPILDKWKLSLLGRPLPA